MAKDTSLQNFRLSSAAAHRFGGRLALTAGFFLTAWGLGLFIFPTLRAAQGPDEVFAPAVIDVANKDFYYDFRNKRFSETIFRPVGPDAANRIKPEPEGLRITLPREQNPADPTGVAAQLNIQGDFEITVGYEIIQADRPQAGWGVSFEVYLQTKTPTRESIAFDRRVRPSGLDVYSCSRMTTNAEGKRVFLPGLKLEDKPASGGKSGRMRITRSGSKATLAAGDEEGNDLKVVYSFDLGTEDLALLRLAASPGNAANIVDLRVHDLRIHGVDPNDLDALNAREPGTRSRGTALWWLAGLIAAGFVIGGLVIWRRKRRARLGTVIGE